ncbi:Linoleoyl-CoA desaturase [Chlamydiales bacterium STE3]|nr:Linoleoyl-CoA desaturase [Chlamydiales bacterium STE3]
MNDRIIKIKFQKAREGEFYDVVKKRVEDYFSKNAISPFANWKMYIKIALLFTFYFSLLAAIYSNHFFGMSLIAIYSLLGFITSLICCNFCHDLLHGAYFKSQKLNKIFGYAYDINGLSSYIWKITHNMKHHTFTNIPGHDEDINKAILLRLSPVDKLCYFHRFQQFYAFLLYLFTSLNWAYYSDWMSLFQESKNRSIPGRELFLFVFFKFVNLSIFLFIPLTILTAPWWQIGMGFLCLHFVGGFCSAVIFQLAHIVENVSYPEPDSKGFISSRWAIHEMETTSNFASGSLFWTCLAGGLNHQIEHHLFPYVCHVHYPKVHEIVKNTAYEFNVPYHEQATFFGAIRSHFRTLKKFGIKEN